MSYSYWQFFLSIESDLEIITHYVEMSPKNYQTYSVAFAQIILSAGSEVDVVSKVLSNKICPKANIKSINDYREIIHPQYPGFHSLEILVPRYGLKFRPWKEWSMDRNPKWWKIYNGVKHERNKYFECANLENALFAVSGLFCLVLYLYPDELRAKELKPWPRLLTLDPELNYSLSSDNRPGWILPDFD